MQMYLENYNGLSALGAKSKIAVFYDDQIDTIEKHIDYAKGQGLCAVVAQNTDELLELMDALWDRAIFFVDMHVPKIYNLASIGFENIDTLRCSAYATAVFKAFHLRFQRVLKFPCILSGMEINEKANDTISDLEDDDFIVGVLKKGNFDEFENVINLYLAYNISKNPEVNEQYQLVGQKLSACKDFLNGWFDDATDIKAAAFGFVDVSDYVSCIVNNLVATKDIEDRCDAIYRVKTNLLSIFNDDIEREKKWMNRPNPALEDRAPIELIKEGHQHQLYKLVAVLERV